MNKYGLLPEVYARLKKKADATMPVRVILSGGQARVASGLLGWAPADLAAKAKASIEAIQDLMSDKAVPEKTQTRVREAFERAGAEFPPNEQPRLRA